MAVILLWIDVRSIQGRSSPEARGAPKLFTEATAVNPSSCSRYIDITLWLFNIAMENSPFIHDFPIKTSIYEGVSMAMLVITRWYVPIESLSCCKNSMVSTLNRMTDVCKYQPRINNILVY